MESTKSPDYAALVKLLPTLKHPVDALGDVILMPGEAEKIQTYGFAARPGRWPVPPIPPELVAGNGLLEHLASRWDPFWALRRSVEEPVEATHAVLSPDAAVPGGVLATQPAPPTTMGVPVGVDQPDLDNKPAGPRTDRREPNARSTGQVQILRLLERHGGHMQRRLLQQKCWRRTREEFNQAVAALIEQQVVSKRARASMLHARGRNGNAQSPATMEARMERRDSPARLWRRNRNRFSEAGRKSAPPLFTAASTTAEAAKSRYQFSIFLNLQRRFRYSPQSARRWYLVVDAH